jgi:hypothetical protein
MANSLDSGTNHEFAKVDATPATGGYFTNHVDIRDKEKKGISKVFFSIREASTASVIAVILQFMCPGDSGWTTYVPLDGSTFAIGNRVSLEDFGVDIQWRAGVLVAGYTSGAVNFGFDW